MWKFVRQKLNYTAMGLTSKVQETSAMPLANADANAVADAEAAPNPVPDIIPGRIANNPVLLANEAATNLIASIPIIGVALVQGSGMGG
ncbi:hypothetical protein J6590_015021 [Homalodisca vitripennis]|nr:hypothetical protein J6590_015021 [Homalodisca vitripennis]